MFDSESFKFRKQVLVCGRSYLDLKLVSCQIVGLGTKIDFMVRRRVFKVFRMSVFSV